MGIFLRDLLANLQESELTRGQVFWYNGDRTHVLLVFAGGRQEGDSYAAAAASGEARVR